MRVMFSALNCEEIEPGEFWVARIRCWTGDHLKYAFIVAVPSLVLWGAGVPALVLLYLFRSKSRLDELPMRIRFGYLFNGYSPTNYFWEFLVIYRKLLIISFAVFLSRLSRVFPALLTLVVLSVSFSLHLTHQPFCLEKFNAMEQKSLVVSTVTLFCGLFYLFREMSAVAEDAFFATMVLTNVYFLQHWLKHSVLASMMIFFRQMPRFRRRLRTIAAERLGGIRVTERKLLEGTKTRYLQKLAKTASGYSQE